MVITQKFIGKVIKNNDTNKKGRVQVDIPEVFIGKIGNDKLPWAKQDRSVSSDIPEVNDLVWCYWHDEINFRNLYYGNKVDLYDYNDQNKESDIKSKIPTLASDYPDIKYQYFKNGIFIGASSDTDNPEFFIVHPTGTHIFINKDGEIDIKSSTTVQIGKETFEKIVKGETFQTFFNNHIHPSPAGPTSPPTIPMSDSELSQNVKVGS
jgi:hypothetical protein